MKMKNFFKRVHYAWTNARAGTKTFKSEGILFLPNGSVLVDPRKSLEDFGYEVVGTEEY